MRIVIKKSNCKKMGVNKNLNKFTSYRTQDRNGMIPDSTRSPLGHNQIQNS